MLKPWAISVAGALAVSFALACDPEICFNTTYADLMDKSDVMAPHRECVARAGGVDAFVCRCTPRVFECLVNTSLANCIKRHARTHCYHYVTDQGLGCSQRLCKSHASG